MSAQGAFADRLLRWFDASRRDLPWRRSRSPYSVVVSELMLQQTTVAAAAPFFDKFTARFPCWEALASAREEDVLEAWAGLGYYRRARSLHAIARLVVAGGGFPATREAALALPGVGPYTAGAVLSIAFGQALPAVDGNVGRVLSRHCGEPLLAARTADRRRLEALALGLQDPGRPGDFNEALMELGATMCTPRRPSCAACPLAADCRARLDDRVATLPPRASRPAPTRIRAEAAWIASGASVLLKRRGEREAVMPGLWELPGGWTDREPRALLKDVVAELGGGSVLETMGVVRHGVTTRRIDVEIVRCELHALPPDGADLAWRRPSNSGLPLTAATRKAIALVEAPIRSGCARTAAPAGGG